MIHFVNSTQRTEAVPAEAARRDAPELRDVAARWRAPDAARPAAATATNIIVFPRVRPAPESASRAAPEVKASAGARPAGGLIELQHARRWALLLVVSLAAHLACTLPFQREPEPMASIGEVAINVELTLGANQDAGLVPEQGSQEVSMAASAPQRTPNPSPDPTPQVEPPTQVAVAEKKPEQPTEVTPTQDPAEPTPVTPAPKAEQPAEKPAQAITPLVTASSAPTEVAAVQAPAVTQATERPVQPVEAKPQQTPEPTAVREVRQHAERGERNDSQASPGAVAAGGVGRGTSDVDTNYRGRVASHIARHKRFPQEARTRGQQGNATVTFSLDERGRVTSATLVSGTGIASLDREATAMIERASPFPAPPGGRAVSFTVPVSFKIR